jgi:CheY-like chemotaxis protein
VVDDDLRSAESIQVYLECAGFRVLCACSADQALEMLGKHPVAALVTDFEMPGKNGIELIEAVRATDPNLATCVISGSQPPEDAEPVWEMWFQKGRSLSELREYLRRRLGSV